MFTCESCGELFRRYDRVVDLTGSIGEHRIDIGLFQVRIVFEDALALLPRGQQPRDVGNRDTQIANARTSMHTLRVGRDPCQ
jgi:hypothetical protein